MCGLFGSIGVAADAAHIDLVSHRGPDGRGWQEWSSPAGRVALGHRRLAIIDVSDAGLQPMQDASGRFHLVFNGEVYNYIELREELRAQGHAFVSQSDSEVLLAAYIAWGEGALARLRGMFAFLIWDDRDKRLFAARDRFGIKPLYLLETGRGVALASEIKQLLALPGVERRMNLARVHDYLEGGITDHTEETLFQGVRQLRGGECATIEASGDRARIAVQRWYAITREEKVVTEREAAAELDRRLREAVRLHLRSDVPVGSCLSGGLDSSSIVCLMAEELGSRHGGPKVNTFSACYAEKSVDEKPFMEAAVAHANCAPHYLYPRADDVFQLASDITWHQDEPFGSTSIFAQWCVFEAAHKAGITVMLDGQGADEQLAGYHFAFPYLHAHLLASGRLGALTQSMRARQALHGAAITLQAKHTVARLLPQAVQSRLSRRRRQLAHHDWLGGDLRTAAPSAGAMQTAIERLGLPEATDLASLCLVMTHASNLQMLLHWEDRNSMAHSIEARVPFLDHPLVEFSLALGNEHKIVGAETKRVLRLAMADVLPAMVRNRQDKLGFATPEQVWFRGPLRQPLLDGVEATLRRFPGLMNATGVRALAADMLEGRRPVDFTLWRIANLGIWGERMGVAG